MDRTARIKAGHGERNSISISISVRRARRLLAVAALTGLLGLPQLGPDPHGLPQATTSSTARPTVVEAGFGHWGLFRRVLEHNICLTMPYLCGGGQRA
jgi:hypothetical protein